MCFITREPDQDNLSSLVNFQHFICRLKVTKSVFCLHTIYSIMNTVVLIHFYKDLLFNKNKFSLLQYLNRSNSDYGLNSTN